MTYKVSSGTFAHSLILAYFGGLVCMTFNIWLLCIVSVGIYSCLHLFLLESLFTALYSVFV